VVGSLETNGGFDLAYREHVPADFLGLLRVLYDRVDPSARSACSRRRVAVIR